MPSLGIRRTFCGPGKPAALPLLLAAEISQAPQFLDSLLIERGLGACAENAPNLLLGSNPLADLRHHPVDLVRIARGNILRLSSVSAAVVKLHLVQARLLAFFAIDELPAGVQHGYGIYAVLRNHPVRVGAGEARRHHGAAPMEGLPSGERGQTLSLHHKIGRASCRERV